MTINAQARWAEIHAQKEAVPEIYGTIDFGEMPERFTIDPSVRSTVPEEYEHMRAEILAEKDQVDFIRAYTLMGDVVADAYAALIPSLGFRRLVAMLTQACDEGLDSVQDAPTELKTFIEHMEHIPDWIDMKKVEEGARMERNFIANMTPFVIRGAFFATFLNTYTALPMAITGSLSNATSARRVKETASFFTTTALPQGLTRYGAGFKAAAMVRLMHSMVRVNVMRKSGIWDSKKYGIPIPQVDQMPAGLISIFLMSFKLIAQGKTEFTPAQQARVEHARYRCYLLGLPEDLLPNTPEGIVKIMSARSATLREDFDDEVCGALLRATMGAELYPNEKLGQRIFNQFERSFSRGFFVNQFLGGDKAKAKELGVDFTSTDKALNVLTALYLGTRIGLYSVAARIPFVHKVADKMLVSRMKRQLAQYGHAEFVSDGHGYKPSGVATERP